MINADLAGGCRRDEGADSASSPPLNKAEQLSEPCREGDTSSESRRQADRCAGECTGVWVQRSGLSPKGAETGGRAAQHQTMHLPVKTTARH